MATGIKWGYLMGSPFTRAVVPASTASQFVTYVSDKLVRGACSKPAINMLKFAAATIPSPAFTKHKVDAALGSGMPIQLIFWGSWWNTAEGQQRRQALEDKVQAVLQ